MKYVNLLLVFAGVAVIGEFMHWSPVLIFFAAALGVIPLAGLMGRATEEIAIYTGPRIGGLLNATLGNAAELIITIIAIRQGLLTLVLASITGSILGNLLLILGLSLFLGGIKNGVQKFDRNQADVNATMLVLAIIAIGLPSLFNQRLHEFSLLSEEYMSLGTAVVMIAIYLLSIFFSFRQTSTQEELAEAHEHHATWSKRTAILVLIAATVAIAFLSEMLVGAVEPVVETLGVSEFFVGIIIVPLVGNVAEHLAAVQVAIKNKMDLSLSISIGSSLQIALFVTPLLVFISLLLGNPMTLSFDIFELAAMFAASLIAVFIALDGKGNWLEGVQLLGVYVILALGFFFLPA